MPQLDKFSTAGTTSGSSSSQKQQPIDHDLNVRDKQLSAQSSIQLKASAKDSYPSTDKTSKSTFKSLFMIIIMYIQEHPLTHRIQNPIDPSQSSMTTSSSSS
jgi:hypothetical protein